jgi:hypothetical protein
MTINELRNAHYKADLVKVAGHITGHDNVSLICDERRIYVKESGKPGFSVEWTDYTSVSDDKVFGTNHEATAQAIVDGLANHPRPRRTQEARQ